MKFTPHKYQKKCIKFGIERPAAGLFLDPGLGKTIISYSIFDIRRALKHCRALLVVTLLRPAHRVWPTEIEKWELDMSCQVLHGAKKDRALSKKSDVYVINYDGLPWLLRQIKEGKAPHLKGAMLVFDESGKLRNTNTQRFKIVRELITYFKYRYILTGNPTPRSLINLFGQIYALDGGERLGRYITHFRAKYCDAIPIMQGGPVAYEIRAGAEAEIYDKIKDIVIRFDDSEIDMPKQVTKMIEVELPRAARAAYDDLKRDLITAIDNQVITAKNAGVASGKLRQIANGGLYVDNLINDQINLMAGGYIKRSWKPLHDEKTQAVVDLLDELEGQPTLIGYEFHHDLERLQKLLPDIPCLTTCSIKEYERLERLWNRGLLPRAFAQINALSHGNNLQGAGRAVIFHSLVWDYDAYDQFIRRIRRQGQKSKRIFVYHIVAHNTMDQFVLDSYQRKGATQNDLFKALKGFLK